MKDRTAETKNAACPELSVVIPCYNTTKALASLHERLTTSLATLGVSYEIVLVNDCSTDDTASKLRELTLHDETVTAVDLMFNVGQFRALLCGLSYCRGDFVVTMDDDLQHPPEEISKLYHHLKGRPDLDAVFGRYIEKKHTLFRNIGSALISAADRVIFNKPPNLAMSSFRCLTRRLVETILCHRTMFPIMGPIIIKSTPRIENIDVHHDERTFGKSGYSLTRLVRTTLDNVLNFSALPLKVIGLVGVGSASLSFLVALFFFVKFLLGDIGVPGWTTLVLLLSFYSGLLLFSMGVIGEYLIRILREVSGHPRFRVRCVYGGSVNQVTPGPQETPPCDRERVL